MNLGYILKRIGVFLIIIWLAATVNFVMPRLAPVTRFHAVCVVQAF